MTNKEIAERLREIADRLRDLIDGTSNGIVLSEYIQRIVDELDPPRPEPGTVVWWRFIGALAYHGWEHGVVDKSLKGIWSSDGLVHWSRIEWKPTRIAGPMQEIVDIPPVSEWPEKTDDVNIWAQYTSGLRGEVLKRITRAEAERREVEG